MARGTQRQTLEAHVQQAACAGCHKAMDPIGYGLQHFDAIGAYRQMENGLPIDATGQLPSGASFDGAARLAEALARDPAFLRCAVEQLYVYALGRGTNDEDPPRLDALAASFQSSGYGLRELVIAITGSEGFRTRHGEPDAGGAK